LAIARQRAVDALMRQQHAAFQFQRCANGAQRLAQLAEIGQRNKLIEGGNLVSHRDGLSGVPPGENPAKPVIIPPSASATLRAMHSRHCPVCPECVM